MATADVRAALRQQIESDRLMGLDCVPMLPASPPITTVPHMSDARGQGSGSRVVCAPASGRGGVAAEQLRVLNETSVKDCTKCGLSASRTQTVFGQGNSTARLVFVGEAPGYEEDRRGLPFVGPAGQLLEKMVGAMGFTRDDVFICNVLKCRPPGNRDPSADEILACSPYLREQIAIIDPEVVVTLGAPASKTLLNTTQSIGRLRGRFHDYYPSGVTGEGDSVPLMPTYHPAYLLRSPSEKGKTWADLQMVMQRLGLALPGKSRT